MAYSVEYLPEAMRDIDKLNAYFMDNARQKGAKFFVNLDKSVMLASEMPEMFPVYTPFPIYRRIVILDWQVFYIVNADAKRIDVHRVMDSRVKLPERLLD